MMVWVYLAILVGMTLWAYGQKRCPVTPGGVFGDKESHASDYLVWGFLCVLLTLTGTRIAVHVQKSLPEAIGAALGLHAPLCGVFALSSQWPLWLAPKIYLDPVVKPLGAVGLSFLRLWIPLKLLHEASLRFFDWGVQLQYWPPSTAGKVFQSYLSLGTPIGTMSVVGFIVIVLAPISEEYLFRGLLFPFFQGSLGSKKASGLCGLAFAGVHANAASFLALCVLGYFLCQLYERYRNLWIPIGVHSLFNANEFIFAISSNFIN